MGLEATLAFIGDADTHENGLLIMKRKEGKIDPPPHLMRNTDDGLLG